MPAPRETIEAAIAQVAAYCEQRSTDDYRIEHTVRGASITHPRATAAVESGVRLGVVEPEGRPVALRRHVPAAGGCSHFGSDDRWHPYELAAPAPEVAPLLAAIERGPHRHLLGLSRSVGGVMLHGAAA